MFGGTTGVAQLTRVVVSWLCVPGFPQVCLYRIRVCRIA
jgi:hypothetical protein